MNLTGLRHVRASSSRPVVRVRIVSAASVQESAVVAAPDDHFASGPHCRVKVSGRRRSMGTRKCPAVRARIVSAPGVQREKAA